MNNSFNDFLINMLPLPLCSEKTGNSHVPVEILRKNENVGTGWLINPENYNTRCECGYPQVLYCDLSESAGIIRYCGNCCFEELIVKLEEITIKDDWKE